MLNKHEVLTTEESNRLLLPPGRITVNRDNWNIRLHDGEVIGGYEIPTERAFTPPDSGPGPQELTAGDEVTGFYGVLPSTDMISGDQLSSQIGLSAGNLINDHCDWFKFSYDKKVLFVPTMPFRYGISWDDLYLAGIVYGVFGVGSNPIDNGVNQTTSITIEGNNYKVRLLRGGDTDPLDIAENTQDTGLADNSEWNRLILATTTGVFSDYTPTSIFVGGMSGGSTICQETPTFDNSRRINRGYNGIRSINTNTSNQRHTALGWRPVLELTA